MCGHLLLNSSKTSSTYIPAIPISKYSSTLQLLIAPNLNLNLNSVFDYKTRQVTPSSEDTTRFPRTYFQGHWTVWMFCRTSTRTLASWMTPASSSHKIPDYSWTQTASQRRRTPTSCRRTPASCRRLWRTFCSLIRISIDWLPCTLRGVARVVF